MISYQTTWAIPATKNAHAKPRRAGGLARLEEMAKGRIRNHPKPHWTLQIDTSPCFWCCIRDTQVHVPFSARLKLRSLLYLSKVAPWLLLRTASQLRVICNVCPVRSVLFLSLRAWAVKLNLTRLESAPSFKQPILQLGEAHLRELL